MCARAHARAFVCACVHAHCHAATEGGSAGCCSGAELSTVQFALVAKRSPCSGITWSGRGPSSRGVAQRCVLAWHAEVLSCTPSVAKEESTELAGRESQGVVGNPISGDRVSADEAEESLHTRQALPWSYILPLTQSLKMVVHSKYFHYLLNHLILNSFSLSGLFEAGFKLTLSSMCNPG